MLRRTGRTTRMLLELALYISKNWDKDKKVILASHNTHYTTSLLKKLTIFFPNAKGLAHTSVTFGRVIVHPANFLELNRLEIMYGINWNAMFIDHYRGEEITQKTIDYINARVVERR